MLAELLPLSITNVQTDQGGDSKYVTTTISGAQFQPNAIVKLVMPGFAEYQPLITDFVNSTEIIAEFDLTGAPHGLYDVQVINPDGQMAIAPYRFEVEQTIEPDVTIGVGGPRFILAGDTGTYSVALAEPGQHQRALRRVQRRHPPVEQLRLPADPSQPLVLPPINVNLYDLPYVELNTNLSGAPPDSSLASDVPLRHAPVAGRHGRQQRPHPGARLPVQRGRRRLHRLHVRRDDLPRAWRRCTTATSTPSRPSSTRPSRSMPRRASSTTGRRASTRSSPACTRSTRSSATIPDIFHDPVRPVPVRHQRVGDDADPRRVRGPGDRSRPTQLRTAILADSTAPTALENLAADQTTWEDLYLAGLEQAGVLLPDGTTPPISQNPLIMSVMATLATGVLAGPGRQRHHLQRQRLAVLQRAAHLVRQQHRSDRARGRLQRSTTTRSPTCRPSSQFNLDAQLPTNFEDFNVYVPWVAWDSRANLPPSFQITSVQEVNGQPVIPLNLDQYINNAGQDAGLASMTGPFTAEDNGFIPTGQALPFTVNFQNDPQATDHAGRDPHHHPARPQPRPAHASGWATSRSATSTSTSPATWRLFQGDFDFTRPRASSCASARASTCRRAPRPGCSRRSTR